MIKRVAVKAFAAVAIVALVYLAWSTASLFVEGNEIEDGLHGPIRCAECLETSCSQTRR